MAVIGIDLGTTNSLVTLYKDGQVIFLKDDVGDSLFPSAVYKDGDTLYVGKKAKEMLYIDQKNTATSFKCMMGTDKKLTIGNTEYTALELSSMVLKMLKNEAETKLGEEIEEAIISVPAYFNDKQRSDTKKAAQLAGLNVKRLINEPSAAALAYIRESGENELNLLVFDFGGGTLDLSYVECFDNIIEIVGVSGDNHLGGDDIDQKILEYVCKEKKIEKNIELLKEIRQKKCRFVLAGQAEADKTEDIKIEIAGVEIDQNKLFEICVPLFQRIKKVVIRALEDAEITMSDIDDFVMVGGSSNLPIVRQFLKELTGKEPLVLGECDKVVAKGVGIYAGIRSRDEEIKDIIMTDVCPFSMGTSCYSNSKDNRPYYLPIINRNTTLPAQCTKRLNTLRDFQRQIKIDIYQGEEYIVENNLHLGEIEINVTPKPAGQAYIDVTYSYDINGILGVLVSNELGETKSITIANQTLSEKEIHEYQKELENVITLTSPWTNKEYCGLKDRTIEYYNEASGDKKEYIGNVIHYYSTAMEKAHIRKMRELANEWKEILEKIEQWEENKEYYLFDLKHSGMEEDEN